MGKGVLLELEGRQAIVLTPQGEFRRVPAPAGTWEIGAEIEFAETQPSLWMKWAKVGAVAAAVFLAVLAPWAYGSLYLPAQVMAIVTVDINPSLELGVNNQGNVIEAQGLNEDGSTVLQGVNWKRRPLADVIADVTEQAISAQKLSPTDDSGAVLVSVAPAGSMELPAETADQLATTARTAAEEVVAAKAEAQGEAPRAHVSALTSTAAEKAEAEKSGLNPGQYMLWKEIQAEAPTVKPEDVKAKGPGKLMKELGLSPDDLFSRAEEHAGPKSGDRSRPGGNPHQGQNSRSTEPTGSSRERTGDREDDKKGSSGRSDDEEDRESWKGSDKDSDQGSEKGKPKESGKETARGSEREQELRERERQAQQLREQERKEQERKEQERREQERREQERREQERKEQEKKDGGKVGENATSQPDSRATQPGNGPPVPPQRPQADAGDGQSEGDKGAPGHKEDDDKQSDKQSDKRSDEQSDKQSDKQEKD